MSNLGYVRSFDDLKSQALSYKSHCVAWPESVLYNSLYYQHQSALYYNLSQLYQQNLNYYRQQQQFGTTAATNYQQFGNFYRPNYQNMPFLLTAAHAVQPTGRNEEPINYVLNQQNGHCYNLVQNQNAHLYGRQQVSIPQQIAYQYQYQPETIQTYQHNNAQIEQTNVKVETIEDASKMELETSFQIKKTNDTDDEKIFDVELVAEVAVPQTKQDKTLPALNKSIKQQMTKIKNSQTNYIHLFGRVNAILHELDERCAKHRVPQVTTTKKPRKDSDLDRQFAGYMRKEKNEELEKWIKLYPKRSSDSGSDIVVLGPFGTTIEGQQFDSVQWTTAPVATRQLLAILFTSDILASHTLTGKPSPAFYGRERPPKMPLDELKVEDIVVCVVSKTGGKERHVRGTITTKCADTAKKYKRRAIAARKISNSAVQKKD